VKIFALLVSLTVLLGCSSGIEPPGPEAPLRALASQSESRRFDLEFWLRQAEADNDLWQTALAFCNEHSEAYLPNCHLVWAADPAAEVISLEDALYFEEPGRDVAGAQPREEGSP